MKKILITIILIGVLIIFVSTQCTGSWLIYHKPEFRGKVMDAETRDPIKGAVVVVMYYSYPIISGPGGGSAYIINVKETLTDDNGIFRIPSYTTFINPNSVEDRADFIIYKPGYLNFYPYRSIPPLIVYVDPEIFFSHELGTKGEMRWESAGHSKDFPVTFGVVELQKLETREQRIGTIPGRPSGMSPEDTPLLYKAINEERKRFGLGQVGRVRE